MRAERLRLRELGRVSELRGGAMNKIRNGSIGGDVEAWQRELAASPRPTTWTRQGGAECAWPVEWSWPLEVDGIFGVRTEAATEAWQAARGLVVDGIVGPKTWAVARRSAPTSRPPKVAAAERAAADSAMPRHPELVGT